jgi:hypothetical protein
MKRMRSASQRGQALLLLVMVVGLGSTWYLVDRLNGESASAPALRKARNAETLNRAKQALIGYIGAQAIKQYEDRPGAFPCPEAPGYFDSTTQDGQTAGSCALPTVGRFPWRTIGTDKLVDAYGEPLWYVVASGWASTGTVINSDCASTSSGMACATGRLTVDGVANDVIALIIAPGPAFSAAASGANCIAWSQSRPITGTPDRRNYLECENATYPTPDSTFATTGPSGSFNDQVVTITVGEVMPIIEAAIAKRIANEIAPALNTVYAAGAYGFPGGPIYPFAAPFANPGPGAGTSSYQGADLTYAGLLPFNQTNCTAAASNPRCLPALIAWQATPAAALEVLGYGYIVGGSQTCSWQSGGDARLCQGYYHEYDTDPTRPIRIEMTATLNNVAMGLRMIDMSKIIVEAKDDTVSGPWESQAVTYTLAMNNGSVVGKPRGSVTITFGATLPNIDFKGWGTYADFRITIDRKVFGDHTLLDTADSTTGWFARNEWFRQTYYAVAPGYTAGTLPPSCTTGTSCLTVTNLAPAGAQRAILILAGREINGVARSPALLPKLGDYLEFGNANAAYEIRTVTPKLASIYADTGSANAYSVAISSLSTGASFQFRAANTNTGMSTLGTAATGTRSLVNENGSNLAAGTIQENAAVQVTWDGTNFVLSKRPFNDRIVAVSSN